MSLISIAGRHQSAAGLGMVPRDMSYNNLNVNDSLVAGHITTSLLRVQEILANKIIADSIEAGSLTVNGVPVTGGGGGGGGSEVVLPGAANEIVTIDATGKLQVSGGGTLVSGGNLNLVNGGNIQFGSQVAFAQNSDKTSIAVGTGAGGIANAGSNNTALGTNALSTLTTGTLNTAIGFQSSAGTTSTNNVVIGANAYDLKSSGVVIGSGAKSNDIENTYVGFAAGDAANTVSGQNAYFGNNVGDASSVTVDNHSITNSTFIGSNSGFGGNVGAGPSNWDSNTAVGTGAMRNVVVSNQLICGGNTCVGASAGANMVSNSIAANIVSNTCVGFSADTGNGKSQSVVVGANAVDLGGGSVVVGYMSGSTTGDVGSFENVVIGNLAIIRQSTTASTGNVIIGRGTAVINNDGSTAANNTIVGSNISLINAPISGSILLGVGATATTSGSVGLGSALVDGGAVGGSLGSIVVNIGGVNRRVPYFA